MSEYILFFAIMAGVILATGWSIYKEWQFTKVLEELHKEIKKFLELSKKSEDAQKEARQQQFYIIELLVDRIEWLEENCEYKSGEGEDN